MQEGTLGNLRRADPCFGDKESGPQAWAALREHLRLEPVTRWSCCCFYAPICPSWHLHVESALAHPFGVVHQWNGIHSGFKVRLPYCSFLWGVWIGSLKARERSLMKMSWASSAVGGGRDICCSYLVLARVFHCARSFSWIKFLEFYRKQWVHVSEIHGWDQFQMCSVLYF